MRLTDRCRVSRDALEPFFHRSWSLLCGGQFKKVWEADLDGDAGAEYEARASFPGEAAA